MESDIYVICPTCRATNIYNYKNIVNEQWERGVGHYYNLKCPRCEREFQLKTSNLKVLRDYATSVIFETLEAHNEYCKILKATGANDFKYYMDFNFSKCFVFKFNGYEDVEVKITNQELMKYMGIPGADEYILHELIVPRVSEGLRKQF